MSKKFFTADSHFGHANIIKHCDRPFINPTYPDLGKDTDKRRWDVDGMDEFMIQQWNSVVEPNDIVYHLGDVGYKCKQSKLEEIRRRLKGQIFLVPGNHDKVALQMNRAWTILPQCHEITIGSPKQRIILCHYALRTWNKSFHGAWHLYGHSHGTLPEDPLSLSFDVGVDCTGFTPMSEREVIAKMNTKIAARNRYAARIRSADGNIYNQGLRDEAEES